MLKMSLNIKKRNPIYSPTKIKRKNNRKMFVILLKINKNLYKIMNFQLKIKQLDTFSNKVNKKMN